VLRPLRPTIYRTGLEIETASGRATSPSPGRAIARPAYLLSEAADDPASSGRPGPPAET